MECHNFVISGAVNFSSLTLHWVYGWWWLLVIAVTAQELCTCPASMTRSDLFSLWSCCFPEDNGPEEQPVPSLLCVLSCHWSPHTHLAPRARAKGIHSPAQTLLPLQLPDRLGWDGGEQWPSEKTFPNLGEFTLKFVPDSVISKLVLWCVARM